MQPQPPPPPYHYAPGPPPPPKSNTLVIVLAIVGGVVAVAIVLAFVVMKDATKYAKKSKRSEADLNLDVIKKGAKVYFFENASFPTGSTGRVPGFPCCDSGRSDRKCDPAAGQWYGHEVWDSLAFSVDDPHYFQYQYEGGADGQSFTAYAIGDLDCDMTEVTYTLEATVVEGNPTFNLTKPARAD